MPQSNPSLTDYAAQQGTTADPRGTIDTSRATAHKLKEKLDNYEAKFPEKTFVEISLALTGHKPIQKTLTEARDALAGETKTELNDTQQDELKQDITLLEAIQSHQTETFQMRKYNTSSEDETPQDVNDRSAENSSPYSLALHNAKISAVAQAAIYDLPNSDESAVILNIEKRNTAQAFSVKFGKYHGGFTVEYTEDPHALIENSYHPENWRRPEDLTD